MFSAETEDHVEKIAKRVALWALVGLLVPVFWTVLGFLLFNARESRWTDLFWGLVYVTCPPWLLPENSWSTVLTLGLDAILYGLIALLVSVGLRASSRKRRTLP
jgi:hypothetical protein